MALSCLVRRLADMGGMSQLAVSARLGLSERITALKLLKPIAWMLLVGVWLLLAVALVTFDSGDWPSHVVAPHNDPVRNLCGTIGAFVAYQAYFIVGIGSWAIMLGLGVFLAVTAANRPVAHPFVRLLGLAVVGLAISCWHALFAPDTGTLTGANAGLIAAAMVPELTKQFYGLGTFLVILAMFGVGAVVAADELVLALPRMLWKAGHKAAGVAVKAGAVAAKTTAAVRELAARPDKSIEAVVVERAAAVSKRKRGKDDAAIDPDAGGLGATQSFDPEAHAAEIEVPAAAAAEPTPAESLRKKLSAEELRDKIAKLPVRLAGTKKPVERDEDILRPDRKSVV